MAKVCFWDSSTGTQKERDCTEDEELEIISRKNAPLSKDEINAPILAQINALDLKRIRPLAEGDTSYLATLNAQISGLRQQLVK